MYSVMLCDDSEEYLSEINGLVLRYIKEHPGRFSEPALFDSPAGFNGRQEAESRFDVCLLDIFMPGISGIELAKNERLRGGNTQLIFITTTREFAVEAIALKSTHYLVKPFTYNQLSEALDRAYESLELRSARTVSLKSRENEIHNVNVDDVISVECFGHIQTVTCRDRVFEMRDGLPVLAEKLFDERFFSIYKGIFVNMDRITFIGADYIIMSDGRKLPSAKRTMPEFKKKYLDRTVGR